MRISRFKSTNTHIKGEEKGKKEERWGGEVEEYVSVYGVMCMYVIKFRLK